MATPANPDTIFDDETQKNLSLWLEGDYDDETKLEIRRLLRESPRQIVDAFYKSVSFGTGGLRGVLGIGPNRMNSYTFGACIQALCNELIRGAKGQGGFSVLIGYDSRHQSREFAELAARVVAGNGMQALLFKDLRPTPLVSFGCRHRQCSAAVMITASHNPPQYSGCKIYWNDGGQVVAPHDKNIMDEFKALLETNLIKSVPSLAVPRIEVIDTEIDEAYYEAISKLQNYREDNQVHGESLKIVYTSLHGTGITVIPKALARWGFTNLHLVERQVIPDGDFPTAKSPNPEEAAALSLGSEMLRQISGDILIATDPDADRVGVAVRHHDGIEVLSGNQLAVLLLEHLCESLTTRNKMPANGAFIKTIVTSELFSTIAEYYQKPCFNVLPGFKYIAEKIRQWEQEPQGRQFVFGAEDSHGYLFGSDVRDKDGVSIAALICEMALQSKLKGKTLIDQLHLIYRRYGIYQEMVISVPFAETKEGKEQMYRSLELMQRRPPKKIFDVEVLAVEDYRRSLKIDLITHQTEALAFQKCDVILYWLKDKSKLVIRPSGTEPKIKIYAGVVCSKFESIEKGVQRCQKHARDLVSAVEQILTEDRIGFGE